MSYSLAWSLHPCLKLPFKTSRPHPLFFHGRPMTQPSPCSTTPISGQTIGAPSPRGESLLAQTLSSATHPPARRNFTGWFVETLPTFWNLSSVRVLLNL